MEKIHYGEVILHLLIEFVLLFVLLYFEGIGIFFSGVIIAASVIYVIVVYFGSKHSGGWDFDFSNRRRVGIGVIVFMFLTLIVYLFPNRMINVFAVFVVLDVLASLLPGKIVFYGRGLWEWSKFLYTLTLLVSLAFLLINLFSPAVEYMVFGASAVVGFVFISLVGVFIIIVLLGLAGHNIQGLRK